MHYTTQYYSSVTRGTRGEIAELLGSGAGDKNIMDARVSPAGRPLAGPCNVVHCNEIYSMSQKGFLATWGFWAGNTGIEL